MIAVKQISRQTGPRLQGMHVHMHPHTQTHTCKHTHTHTHMTMQTLFTEFYTRSTEIHRSTSTLYSVSHQHRVGMATGPMHAYWTASLYYYRQEPTGSRTVQGTKEPEGKP